MTEIGAGGLQTANLCRIDGAGLQFIEKIEGDAFTAAGVPMLSLLAELPRSAPSIFEMLARQRLASGMEKETSWPSSRPKN